MESSCTTTCEVTLVLLDGSRLDSSRIRRVAGGLRNGSGVVEHLTGRPTPGR